MTALAEVPISNPFSAPSPPLNPVELSPRVVPTFPNEGTARRESSTGFKGGLGAKKGRIGTGPRAGVERKSERCEPERREHNDEQRTKRDTTRAEREQKRIGVLGLGEREGTNREGGIGERVWALGVWPRAARIGWAPQAGLEGRGRGRRFWISLSKRQKEGGSKRGGDFKICTIGGPVKKVRKKCKLFRFQGFYIRFQTDF